MTLAVHLCKSVALTAGNSRISACEVAPADVTGAITVGGTNLVAKFENVTSSADADSLYEWTNTGPCIDVCAPAVDIPSACSHSAGGEKGIPCQVVGNTSFTKQTGTSFAAPQVAGAAAMWLGEHKHATPPEVRAAVLGSATPGKLANSMWPLNGTPDLILYTDLWDLSAADLMRAGPAAVSDSAAADVARDPEARPPGGH